MGDVILDPMLDLVSDYFAEKEEEEEQN